MAIKVIFTTGPVENAIGFNDVPGVSRSIFVKALNNSTRKKATVRIDLFLLNGKKRKIASRTFTLRPQSSNFAELRVELAPQFEVRITTDNVNVLVSAWGKTARGRLVAAHRFTQNEMVRSIV
jgi:hypothetical protein